MKAWIGIDDTDNADSRGTGYIARILAANLKEQGLGNTDGITRHQLLVDPAIPYTSHNSSLCIHWETNQKDLNPIVVYASQFLKEQSADGSDPGLCVAFASKITEQIKSFGLDAKIKVLEKSQAINLAEQLQLHLVELGGRGGGVIGALAGVGLASSGNDGRFIWLKGIREMQGIFTAREIYEKSGVEIILPIQEECILMDDLIDIGEWFRPIWLDHKAVLLVEAAKNKNEARWKIFDREFIKAHY